MSGELRIKVFPKFGIERFEFIVEREFEARRLVSTLIHRIRETNRMNRDEEIVAKFHRVLVDDNIVNLESKKIDKNF